MVQKREDKRTAVTTVHHIITPPSAQSPAGASLYYAWFAAMHTRIDIAVVSTTHSELQLNAIMDEVAANAWAIEREANRFDPTSALSVLNSAPANTAVSLPERLCHMLEMCRDYHRQTLGLFDITIGSVGHSPRSIDTLYISNQSATRLDDRLSLDLSGFVKGYAAEQTRTLLSSHGISHALINFGNSSIAAMGSIDTQTAGWSVCTNTSKCQSVTLHDNCLTTSGNDSPTRRHIINPLTGNTIDGMRTLSVITDNAIDGEVLSTALFIASEQQRETILHNISATVLETSQPH